MEQILNHKARNGRQWHGRRHLSPVQARDTQRIPVQSKVFYATLNRQGQGIIWNLSTKGCLIEGDMFVKRGDKLSLVLYHPTTHRLIIIDKARVVWTKGGQFGLAHETIYPSELGQLNALVSASPTI